MFIKQIFVIGIQCHIKKNTEMSVYVDRLDLVQTVCSRAASETLSLVTRTSVIRSDDLPSTVF